jgi:hypothetical protein
VEELKAAREQLKQCTHVCTLQTAGEAKGLKKNGKKKTEEKEKTNAVCVAE